MSNPEIKSSGDKFWRNEQDQLHREDGPSVIWLSGSKFWYVNGKRHREDGPAIYHPNGDNRWYLNDIEYTEEEYKFIQFMKGIMVNG